MRVAVLWTDLSGYLKGCLRELASREGVELFIACSSGSSDAPFDSTVFECLPIQYRWSVGQKRLLGLAESLERFSPQVIIFTGWAVPGYRDVAHKWRGRARRIMTMDNCWLGTAKQFLGILTAPLYIKPLAEAVWLPGERQALFAAKLGFQQSQIFRGLYTCDNQRFVPSDPSAPPYCRKTFLFAGRLIREKGINTLVEAYRRYRDQTNDPWNLKCIGVGPLEHLLVNIPGINAVGFIQPDLLPGIFATAECLVMPSIFEPWAVVVHEAASMGLLILAATSVGSTPHLVQSGYNGFVFDKADVESLTDALLRVSALPPDKRLAMSKNSVRLASQFSIERWTETVLEFAQGPIGGSW